MKFIVFDTETTSIPRFRGLPEPSCLDKFNVRYPNHIMKFNGEVIQFAGLVCDENFALEKIISFYCMPSEPISQEAFNVNKISNEMIYDLSKGKRLEDYLIKDEEIHDLLFNSNNLFIGHNVKFDMKVINDNLLNYCYPEINFGESVKSFTGLDKGSSYHYDTMSNAMRILGLRKRPKLIELVKMLVPEVDLDRFCSYVMNQHHKTSSVKLHDACYDAICTWLAASKLREKSEWDI